MSQQINLINPALRKTKDWLTATVLAVATGIMVVVIVGSTILAKQAADARFAEAERSAAALKAAQDRLMALSKEVGELKPDPKLGEELSSALKVLSLREDVIKALEGGAGSAGGITGFSEYFRGFARQVPSGLWLTGIVMDTGSDEMEIRGRMLNPASLPDYIQRLNSEKAFSGKGFSNLAILRPAPDAAPVGANASSGGVQVSANASAATATVPKSSPFVDFMLTASSSEKSATQLGGKK